MITSIFFFLRHLGHGPQFAHVAVRGAADGGNGPVHDHVAFAGFCDHGFHRGCPFHPGDFDAVVGAVGKGFLRGGQIVGIPAGNAFLFHEVTDFFQHVGHWGHLLLTGERGGCSWPQPVFICGYFFSNSSVSLSHSPSTIL
jgi:hypothetical protein